MLQINRFIYGLSNRRMKQVSIDPEGHAASPLQYVPIYFQFVPLKRNRAEGEA